MKIVLATGIYPPNIGGPATYVKNLAVQLVQKGHEVVVITYGNSKGHKSQVTSEEYPVILVSKFGGPLVRWLRYAKQLKKHGDADIVYAFSSVSCGMPVIFARLTLPKKILRLGGDFFWERYTDRGGNFSLREWYRTKLSGFSFQVSGFILRSFDHIVFSTKFQQEIYESHYENLPPHSVIENAVPSGNPVKHEKHKKFRLLFMGRFVGFKNLPTLVRALKHLDDVQLTFVGSGPLKGKLKSLRRKYRLKKRIKIEKPVHGEEKRQVLLDHDLLVIPSITEISPNVALEARAAGLPVLLTQETGLTDHLRDGMIVTDLSSEGRIAGAIVDAMEKYDQYATAAAESRSGRDWDAVSKEHIGLFGS